eukprot:scaffold7418_cov77-Cyclotella_meneghiniana.AAC.6
MMWFIHSSPKISSPKLLDLPKRKERSPDLRSCVCDVGVGVRLRVFGAPIYIGTTMYLLLLYYNSERRLHKRMANFLNSTIAQELVLHREDRSPLGCFMGSSEKKLKGAFESHRYGTILKIKH